MPFRTSLPLARYVFAFLFSAAMLHATLSASQATQPATSAAPVQAELIAPLDATHVRPGLTVFARVQTQWSAGACVLSPGSMVIGHVSSFTKRSKTDRTSSLQLVFDKADCKAGSENSPRFALLALIGPDDAIRGTPVDSGLPLAVGSGSVRNVREATAIAGNRMAPVRKLPSNVKPGDVIDVPKTRLKIAEDRDTTDVIADGKDVRLEPGTILILLPQHTSTVPVAADLKRNESSSADPKRRAELSAQPGAAKAAEPVAIPEPPDVTEICSGACTFLAGSSEAEIAKTRAASTVSLSSLGLLPAGNRELAHFTFDTSVVYLDATHLLCTFDPHRLRERTEIDGEPSRLIRAVVVDTTKSKIERVLDWHVRGEGQYLWQLSSGHLLVHLGRDLKELDSELKPVRSLHLDGRLAWVVSSPAGSHVAIGTVAERYSAAVRKELEQNLQEEPEEDIRVRVFGDGDQAILDTVRSSHVPPPVLSDTGELRVAHDTRDRWKLTEVDWQRKERLLATPRTSCRPTLSTPHHNLIFMMGCTSLGSRWYRVLHDDGRPILKAEAIPNEFQQKAQASDTGSFAIRTVELERALAPTEPFRPSDLKQERISVYSATGSRLSTVATDDFAPAEQGYALSPKGDQVALLGRSTLYFYPVATLPR